MAPGLGFETQQTEKSNFLGDIARLPDYKVSIFQGSQRWDSLLHANKSIEYFCRRGKIGVESNGVPNYE